MTDKEFADKVIEMAEQEGKNAFLFLADEQTANFHYRVFSLSRNPLVTATLHWLNKQFSEISHQANTRTQIMKDDQHGD